MNHNLTNPDYVIPAIAGILTGILISLLVL